MAEFGAVMLFWSYVGKNNELEPSWKLVKNRAAVIYM